MTSLLFHRQVSPLADGFAARTVVDGLIRPPEPASRFY